MTLNVDKTNVVHFRLGGNISNRLNVHCNGLSVPQVDHVKYLGFIVDERLTWGPHIELTCGRLSSACFALSRLESSLSLENMKKAYFGYFHAVMLYGVEFWGLAAERDRIFKAQKRAIRIVSGVQWDHPARELFKSLKILTLPCQFILQAATYVRNNLEQFSTWADSHDHLTRRRHRLQLPALRLSKSQRQVHFVGVKVYNALPERIIGAPSPTAFRSQLKSLLLDKAYYNVDEFFNEPFT